MSLCGTDLRICLARLTSPGRTVKLVATLMDLTIKMWGNLGTYQFKVYSGLSLGPEVAEEDISFAILIFPKLVFLQPLSHTK